MNTDLEQFYEIFFEEAGELLAEMETRLLNLDILSPDPEDLNAIFRAAHSIKGGAGTFGFTDMAGLTHVLESLLDRLRKGEFELRAEMMDIFLHARDVLRDQLNGHKGNSSADPTEMEAVNRKLKELEMDTGSNHAAPEYPPAIDQTTEAAAAHGEKAENRILLSPNDLVNSGVKPPARAAVSASHSKQSADHSASSSGNESSSIRVSVEKVDQMINLVGELAITQTILAQTASQIDSVIYEKLLNGLNQLERNTRDLQEAVMSIRMMPINFVFSRFPRVVREIASRLGKQVDLKIAGEGTELDKGLIEKITDPLTHLIRNSLDHGIETPEKRKTLGKPERGTIILRASHQGGSVVIEVMDDGAGLNRDKILVRAQSRGLPVSENMTDQAVWMLIFEAGFSTADVVTDVSGRGVGMDVVKRNIEELDGRVEIDSVTGKGTKISIHLPLTLAILDGLSVSVGDQMFIIPLAYITELLKPAAEDIRIIRDQGRVVQVHGECLPVVALHEIFNLESAAQQIHEGILVILDAEGSKAAMFVDTLIDQHQVVIKSLENNYRRIQGVSGATIMGDGSVALILDIAGLVNITKQRMVNAA